MNPNESWIAEQARLLMLEDGFGPSYAMKSAGPPGLGEVSDEAEALAGQSSA